MFFSRSKYFRGRRLFNGEFDVRVEQAELRELTVNANSDAGVTASIVMHKTGNKVVRYVVGLKFITLSAFLSAIYVLDITRFKSV